jgi:hypothetical protein
VQFIYDHAMRVVEIHCVGYAKEDRPMLLAWQVRGGSKSRNPNPWRNFYLDQISEFLILEERSEAPRDGYAGGGSSMQKIIREI